MKTDITLSLDEAMRVLIEHHVAADPDIERIYSLRFDDPGLAETIGLLEVNRATVPSGILPVHFGPAADVPFPMIFVEVTPKEFDEVRSGDLKLPTGWEVEGQVFARDTSR